MTTCPRPVIEYPCRVPLKVIGRQGLMDPLALAALILVHLGPQAEADLEAKANPHGAYIAFTFWVVLPSEDVERPLREAFLALPGYVMQL